MNNRALRRLAGSTTSLEAPPADFALDVAEAHALDFTLPAPKLALPPPTAIDAFTTPLVFSAPGTAVAVRDRSKDVTRRLAGREGQAARWHVNKLARAYQKSPRAGGQPFGHVRILSVEKQLLTPRFVTLEEVRREGFTGFSPQRFVELFCSLHPHVDRPRPWLVWRIEFQLEWLAPHAEGW